MQHRSTYDRLNARVEELVGQRHTTENTWQEISDHLVGRRDFNVTATPGRQRMQRIYDGTAKSSSSLLAGAMHALLVSPTGKWFELAFEEPALNDVDEAMIWLNLAEKRCYSAMAAPTANFHAGLSEVFKDLIDFGTGGLFIDDVEGVGVQFSARPLPELYLAEDPSGRIDTIVRKFQLTARQAVKLWGDEAKAATKKLEGMKTEDKDDYVHIILPNDDVAVGKVDSTGMKWASFFLSTADRAVVGQGGYHELPMATPRWEKDSGEVYGRGPGWNALSDHRMLNEIKRVTIIAGQKAISPPMLVEHGSVLPGDLSFEPNAVIVIDSSTSMGMNPPVQPLQSGSNFNISDALISDTRREVQDGFHKPLLDAIRDPRMTATQVLQLSAQAQRHLAPILGRMTTELLEPTVERVFAIEKRALRLPPVPAVISDQPLKINYVSPVARSQQTSDAQAIIDLSGFVSEIAAVSPDVLDVVDFDIGIRELADALGVPRIMIRDSRAVAVRREAATQMAEEQQDKEDAVMLTDQIAKLAKAAPQEQTLQ